MIKSFLVICGLSLTAVSLHNISYANVNIEGSGKHNKYVYNFPLIVSCNDDLHLTYNLLKSAYLQDNYIEISNLVKNKHIRFDVSNEKNIQELNIFAVRAAFEQQPQLVMNIIKSYNPRKNAHMIALGVVAKALISQGYVKEAESIVMEISKNDQNNESANRALGSIAKRAAYTPGAEYLAFDIEKSRRELNPIIRKDIEKRKITYDKHVWEAKILFIEKTRSNRKEEIIKIIKLYDPSTDDGVRKLTILAKDALRAREFNIAKEIIAKIESVEPKPERDLGSIAKAAVYIHGGIPIALDIAKNLGYKDSYSKKIKELVAKVSEEHLESDNFVN